MPSAFSHAATEAATGAVSTPPQSVISPRGLAVAPGIADTVAILMRRETGEARAERIPAPTRRGNSDGKLAVRADRTGQNARRRAYADRRVAVGRDLSRSASEKAQVVWLAGSDEDDRASHGEQLVDERVLSRVIRRAVGRDDNDARGPGRDGVYAAPRRADVDVGVREQATFGLEGEDPGHGLVKPRQPKLAGSHGSEHGAVGRRQARRQEELVAARLDRAHGRPGVAVSLLDTCHLQGVRGNHAAV